MLSMHAASSAECMWATYVTEKPESSRNDDFILSLWLLFQYVRHFCSVRSDKVFLRRYFLLMMRGTMYDLQHTSNEVYSQSADNRRFRRPLFYSAFSQIYYLSLELTDWHGINFWYQILCLLFFLRSWVINAFWSVMSSVWFKMCNILTRYFHFCSFYMCCFLQPGLFKAAVVYNYQEHIFMHYVECFT